MGSEKDRGIKCGENSKMRGKRDIIKTLTAAKPITKPISITKPTFVSKPKTKQNQRILPIQPQSQNQR